MPALSTEAAQKALATDFDDNIQAIEHNVDNEMAESTSVIDQMHKLYLEELQDLVQRRMAIEKEIVETSSELEKAHDRNKYLLKVVVDARIEEGAQLLKELKQIEK